MIELVNVSKHYQTSRGATKVFDGLNLTVKPGERVGVLGRNGAGKSTLIRLIGGIEAPDSGRIKRTMSVSWPLAFSGGFQGSLSGLDNLKFICRIYGISHKTKLAQVDEFAELGKYLYEPVKTYSSGMRARLAFALSMAIEFDCYLIDEVMAVGDARFTQKCHEELLVRRRDRALIVVSHIDSFVSQYCHSARVLQDGKLHDFKGVAEALHFYKKIA